MQYSTSLFNVVFTLRWFIYICLGLCSFTGVPVNLGLGDTCYFTFSKIYFSVGENKV